MQRSVVRTFTQTFRGYTARTPSTCSRTFASCASMSQKFEWLVILPDNPNVLDKRMEVRAQHLSNLKPDAEAGYWAMGGATLERQPEEGKPMSLNGSVMLAIAETQDEVMERLKKDIYATSGVWNMNEVKVYPFKPAFRTAL